MWSQSESWPLLAIRMTLCEDMVDSAQAVPSVPFVLSGGSQGVLWIQVTSTESHGRRAILGLQKRV